MFKKGDKILFGGRIVKCSNYDNYYKQILYKSGKYIFIATNGILAETTDVQRAVKHVKKDMWIEYFASTNFQIKKVAMVDLMSKTNSFFTNGKWIENKKIKKIYFYSPLECGDSIEKMKTEIEYLKMKLHDLESKCDNIK